LKKDEQGSARKEGKRLENQKKVRDGRRDGEERTSTKKGKKRLKMGEGGSTMTLADVKGVCTRPLEGKTRYSREPGKKTGARKQAGWDICLTTPKELFRSRRGKNSASKGGKHPEDLDGKKTKQKKEGILRTYPPAGPSSKKKRRKLEG